MPEDAPKTYSISLRVQRTKVEYAYVLVPVDSQIMQTDEAGNEALDANGHAHIDKDKFCAQALSLAQSATVAWYEESTTIAPHPIQKAPGENERAAYFSSPSWE